MTILRLHFRVDAIIAQKDARAKSRNAGARPRRLRRPHQIARRADIMRLEHAGAWRHGRA
jgi:hypothetical protein